MSVAVFGISAWMLQSCMPTTVTGVELNYEEKIVIYASLISGEPLKNIQITRTLPPLDTFNVERSRIENAAASISVDGTSYPLRLQARVAPTTTVDSINFNIANQASLYEAPGLIVQPGKSYSIQVSWNNKQASATTRIPLEPILSAPASVNWRPEPFRYVVPRERSFPASGIAPSMLATVIVPVMARQSEAYRIESFVARDTVSRLSTTNLISLNTTTLLGANAGMPLNIQSQTRFFLRGDTVFKPIIFALSTATTVSVVRVIAHDDALLNFIATQARNSPNASPFGNSGQNPLWNVTGQGIGLFIGQSRPLQLTVRP
jgi:hypothetical protein